MCKELPFDPFPFLHDPHQQTIISAMLNLLPEPYSERKFIQLDQGDKLTIEITTPHSWKPNDRTVVLVHGLCGSHRSPNVVRMVNRLEPLGFRCVRFNMRCCGSGRGLSKQIYHSGRSEDLFRAIHALKEQTPDSPITLIGFSLGGNISLKLAGELNSMGSMFLEKVIAVSAPVDLYTSVQLFDSPSNAFYEKYFYKLLRNDVHYIHGKFKDLPQIRLPRSLKLYEFDQLYTAPRCGFRSAQDYYNKCSSLYYITDIAVPTKILLAEDDPIVSSSSLDSLILPSAVELYKTKKGGHMGYLGHPSGEKGVHWLDGVLEDWVLDR